MPPAFEWLEQRGGSCTGADYAYTGRDGKCKPCTPAVKVLNYESLPAYNVGAMESKLQETVLAIGVSAGNSAFQFYSRGVLDSRSCGTDLDHGVAIVGMGNDAESGKDYFLVRNSWGKSWGEGGHIRLVRGKNMCGCEMEPSYVVTN